MNWYLQLELKRDSRCRLFSSFVYVAVLHTGWYRDPDTLARWYNLITFSPRFSNGCVPGWVNF